MAKNKRTAKGRRHSRRNTRLLLVSVLAIVITLACAVGGTLAWLVSASDPVVNTFTYGDINITLTETDTDDGDGNKNTNEYTMMPGAPIEKDPLVTVKQGSEACWLFVKLEKSDNFDDFMTYAMEEGWVQLKDETGAEIKGVFFRRMAAEDTAAADKTYQVIKDDTITVKDRVTKEELNALDDTTYPSLTITAYAVQQVGFEPEVTDGATAPDDAQLNAAALKAWDVAQSDTSGGENTNP